MRNCNTSRRILAVFLALAALVGCFAVTAFATDTAEEFVTAVAAIEAAVTPEAKEEALSAAEGVLAAHIALGGSTEDAAIAEAYEKYLTLKADIEVRVEYYNEYTELLDIVTQTEITYTEFTAHHARLKELEELIGLGYRNMAELSNQLFSAEVDTRSPILTCKAYIQACLDAANSTTYEDAYTYTKRAKMIEDQIKDIDGNISYLDYPELEDGRKNIEKAERFMQMRLIEATPFILAVRNINKAESIPAGVAAAYAALEGIDQTTDGVPSAMETLAQIENNYNNSASYANARVEEINSMLFGFIF